MGADDIDKTDAGGSDGGQRRSQPDDSPFSRENAAATGGATPPAETPPGDGASRGQQRHVPVSPATAQVFGRPAGVRGSFASTPSSSRPAPQIAPPDAVLAEAFGRPEGSDETLQRDPLAAYGVPTDEPAPPDPWRCLLYTSDAADE